MIKDWANKSIGTLSKEFWGETVDHPLLRRILAIVVDYFVLTPFYFLVALVFVRDYQKLLILDFSITLTYLAVLNSKHFGGQTIGKRIFKLQTTDEQGNQINLLKSFIRGLPISLLMSGQLILLYFSQASDMSLQIAVVVLIFISFGLAYFSLIKLNRQGLHDIIASTQVIFKSAKIQTSKNLHLGLVLVFLILTSSFVTYLIYLWRVD